jgi:hypothetical protein
MPTPTIPAGNLYMNATLYTGTGGTQTVSNGVAGQSFQPDMVWIKSRSAATDNKLTDSVRGATKALISNTAGAETTDTNGLTAFGTSGFTLGTDTTYNNNAATYVGWNWKAGGTAVSNTAGTITSQVSANTTSGFSVVTYTGNGSAGATVGHGLGAAPSMFITKQRNGGVGSDNWQVYHTSLGNTQRIFLNLTDAASTTSAAWNNTSPTSSVFSLGTSNAGNGNTNTYVAYCWAPIAGYSQFGSYTGNGSTDGPFIYTGFRPRFILFKKTNTTGNWIIYDSSRSTYNLTNLVLFPMANDAESTTDGADFLSNGFKLRSVAGTTNASGGTYIYAAFAENPFKYANAR